MTSPHTYRSILRHLWRYMLALGLVGAGVLLCLSMPQVLSPRPFLAFWPMLVIAAEFGGIGPGLLATAASALCVHIILHPPYGGLSLNDWVGLTALGIFLAGGLAISVFIGVKRKIQSRQHLQAAAMQSVANGIALTDAKGVILWVNPAFCVMTGYAPKEIVGKTHRLLDSGEQNEAFYGNLWSTVRQREAWHGELLGRRKNGTIYAEERGVTPMTDADGRIIHYVLIMQDITERKRAEETLRQSERKYRRLHESITDGFVYVEMTGKIRESNRSYQQMVGYTNEELLQLSYTDLTPEPWQAFEQGIVEDQILVNGYSEVYEKEYRKKDGTVFPVELRVFLIKDESGGSEGMWAIVRDITERKQAEEALRESEELYRTLVAASPDAISMTDTHGLLAFASRVALQMFGYSPDDDLIGRSVLDWVSPEHREMASSSMEHILAGGAPRDREYTLIKKDGTRFVGEINAAAFRSPDGNPGGMLLITRDITERRQVQERLRETRDFLENLLDYANAPIIVWDSQLKITRFNRAFERLTGRKSGDVLGLGLDFLFPPEKRMESLAYIQSTSIGERWETVEIPIQHMDGSACTLLWNSATLYGADGKTVVATIAQGHDITQWRQAQEQQRKLEAQLAQAQKMEAIGTLAGGIAHDFNNILGIIMGNAEIVELHLVKDSPAKRNIDEVVKAAYRAKDLVKQILTFSRKGEQEQKPMQVIPVIEEVLKLLRASLPTTIEMRPEIDLSPGDDQILGDPTQVTQILMNLSTNAAHAMLELGGTLRVALSLVQFSSSDVGKPLELGSGNYLKLTVEDSGHGMDQTTIDHIFDPFFTTKGPGEGTGLGLAVVHGIVTNHGGAITVSSEPGKGTAFQVYLPRLEAGETSQPETLAAIPTGRERILLVDDEEALATAVKAMLEHLGYEVTATTSSRDALDLFRLHPDHFDLVITDQTMPNMTGQDLAKEVIHIRPDVPIILCTGFSERIDEDSAGKMGFSAFAMKPVSVSGIAATVRRVLDTKQS
jgi:PAS domain S-box-containing protein